MKIPKIHRACPWTVASVMVAASVLTPLMPACSLQAADSMIWPLYRGNAQRTRVSPFKGPEKMRVRWEVTLTHEIASAPVVDEKGRLYLAAGTDAWCADAAEKVSWRHDFAKSRHADKFGSWNGFLTALELDGKVRWALDLKDRLTSAPAVTANGEVLIVSFEGTLFKVSAKDELIWQTEAKGRYSSPLVTADGRVLVGTQDGFLRVYALADGKLVSELKLLPNWGAITASPVPGGDGVIYLGGQDGVQRAIE